MASHIMKVNQKGMVTIPLEIREKYKISEGTEVKIMDINGQIEIIPIIPFDELRKNLPTRNEMIKIIEETELETREIEQ